MSSLSTAQKSSCRVVSALKQRLQRDYAPIVACQDNGENTILAMRDRLW